MRLQSFGGRSKVPTARPVAVIRGAGGVVALCGGTDTFTGTDGALGTTATDQPWTQYPSGSPDAVLWEVVSDELAMVWTTGGISPTDAAQARMDVAMCSPDQFLEFDWLTRPSEPDGFIYFVAALRAHNASSWYLGGNAVWFEFLSFGAASGGLDIETIVYSDAEPTGEFDYQHIDDTDPDGSTFRCEVNGPDLKVFRDSIEIYSYTPVTALSPTDPAGLYGGLAGYPVGTADLTVATFDNFTVGDI